MNRKMLIGLVLAVFAAATLSASAMAAEPGVNLVEMAASKLTPAELGALLSTPIAVAGAALDDVDTTGGPSVEHVLANFRKIMSRFGGPLKFIAADGSQFDCYGEYVAYQWGGIGLPCD